MVDDRIRWYVSRQPRTRQPTASYRGKRLFDLSLAIPALLVTAPVQVFIAGLVAVKLGRPVFFKQVRPGLGGQPFELIKFRTMLEPGVVGQVDNASRHTPFGRALRSTSLDELPEIWNVIRGDMSLVGPRPLLMRYLPLYTTRQARRHEVKPGLTGLAQVSGRNALSWSEKFELDVAYVERCSLRLDIEILLRTIGAVLRREGISPPSSDTMPPFTGNADLS